MNCLYYGDNLQVLRENIKDESIDLIYLDPPFNSKANYNILFKGKTGESSSAQIEAFEDTWHWGHEAEKEFSEILHCQKTHIAEMITALRSFLGENDMMAYLVMMTNRIIELHRVLKNTGSIYLHCDPTASHYLKVLMDGIFGQENYKNTVSWKRSSRRSAISKSYRRAHDELLVYNKSDEYTFNIQYEELDETLLKKYTGVDDRGKFRLVPLMASGITRNGETGKPWRGFDPNTRGKGGMHWLTTHNVLEKYADLGLVDFPRKIDGVPQLKYYLEQNKGIPLSDFWDDINLINSMGNESLGYPTQKPLALLDRIISISSNENDVVLDPFCGCGTAVHASQRLNRNWIGIDITHLAISLIEKRMKDAFPEIDIEVHGTPKDIDSARNLAERDKYQFQWWACSLVGAQPFGGKKKGADGGIDGLIYIEDNPPKPNKIVVSVKGGENIGVSMIRDLAHVVDREKAVIGLFVTLFEPSRPMITEAVTAGFYESPINKKKYPKIQILTVEDLLTGAKRAEFPDLNLVNQTLKQAPKEVKKVNQYDMLKDLLNE